MKIKNQAQNPDLEPTFLIPIQNQIFRKKSFPNRNYSRHGIRILITVILVRDLGFGLIFVFSFSEPCHYSALLIYLQLVQWNCPYNSSILRKQ